MPCNCTNRGEETVKFKSSTLITINIALFAALGLPLQLAAQRARYKLIDLGTFGGPSL